MKDSKRPTVSLCMIVRNEERNLEECLRPVASLFDQIVIVDTGSVDATRNIAEKFTSHVYDFPWCDDFSAARNESIRHATGDWILWLDADDRLDEENVQRLQELLASLGDAPAVHMLNTICLPREDYESETLITHARLFRNHEELRFVGRVHEQLDPWPGNLGYEVKLGDVCIRHVGYRDAAQVQRKLQRDIRLLRMDYALDPTNHRTLLHLGTTYGQLGKSAEARSFLEQVLASSTTSHDYLRRVISALAQLSLADGRVEEAAQVLARGRAMFPDNDYLAYLQAEVLYELDDYEGAKNILLSIINSPETAQFRAGAPRNINSHLAPRSLGEVLRIQRQLPAAEAVLKIVVERFPHDTLAWHGLGRVYIDARSRAGLDAVCQRLDSCPRGELFGPLLQAAWSMMHAEWRSAENLLDQLIALAPQMPMLRLMRAEVLTRRGAALAPLLQAYRDVLRVQPGNPAAAAMVQRLEGQLHRPATVAPTLNLATTIMVGPGAAV